MLEFLFGKKEARVVTPVAASEVKKAETVAAPETMNEQREQAAESVEKKYEAILSQSGSNSQVAPVAEAVADDAERVGQAMDAASRVNQLVELAQLKGVAHAVSVARKMNDLYVLDTMHDELADRLYEALKAKGLLQGE